MLAFVGGSGSPANAQQVKPAAPALRATPNTEAQASSSARGAHAEGHILVAPNPSSTDQDFDAALNTHGGRSMGKLRGLNVHVVNVSKGKEKDATDKLSRHPHVKFAEVDTLIAPGAIADDPNFANAWHLSRIGATTAWDQTMGAGITIAILDTGIDASHPDLAPQLVPGWNFYDNNGNTSDIHGHGTAVAGIAAAASNNGIGVASVAGRARIMPVRISDPSGYAYWSTVAQGITWAADNGARVANISYQGAAASGAIQNAASYMRSRGGVVFVASGNTGGSDGTAPSNVLMVVSATDSSDALAGFSTYGNFVGISAPGVGIWTTTTGGGYGAVSGTSAATPVVAGTAALVLSARPSLSPSQVDSTLKSTATDLGAGGTDPYFGSGRVNAGAAVQSAAGSSGTQDTSAPSVSITSPTGGTVSGTTTVSVNASDNVGVTRVDFRVNGTTVASDSSAPHQFNWNSATVADGAASLTAVAYDAAGNSRTSAAVNVTVSNVVSPPSDTTAPTVSIASPAGGTVSGSVPVSVNASDNVAVTRVDLRVNGAVVASAYSAAVAVLARHDDDCQWRGFDHRRCVRRCRQQPDLFGCFSHGIQRSRDAAACRLDTAASLDHEPRQRRDRRDGREDRGDRKRQWRQRRPHADALYRRRAQSDDHRRRAELQLEHQEGRRGNAYDLGDRTGQVRKLVDKRDPGGEELKRGVPLKRATSVAFFHGLPGRARARKDREARWVVLKKKWGDCSPHS